MRSPITGMVIQYQSLTPEEQKVFLDLVDPQPEPEAPAKQKRKRTKRAEPLSEERRAAIHRKGLPPVASGMATAIKNSLEEGQQAAAVSNGQKCTATVPGLDVECGQPEHNPIHDPNGGYGGYHEFEGPKSKKAAK